MTLSREQLVAWGRRNAGRWEWEGEEVEVLFDEESGGLSARSLEDGREVPVGAVLSSPRSRKLDDD